MSQLASYAQGVSTSKGRLYNELSSVTRTPFARDRDRIIHCTAFRRLRGKTQVFVANGGDYFRTRLTHSLEVAQVARSLAHSLGLDEDLAETIGLAHDLGHPPFGHAGEDELHRLFQPWGGYDHNVQTFRVVTQLEERYPAFDGLNLTWETLEGIIKHNGPIRQKFAAPSWKAIVDFNAQFDLLPDGYASLEAQCAAVADDIAYNSHDVDDGLQSGLFQIDELMDIPLIGPALAEAKRDWPDLSLRMWRIEAVRRMIGAMIKDVLQETRQGLASHKITNVTEVRAHDQAFVRFSPHVLQGLTQLRAFLHEKMYQHYQINQMRAYARRVLRDMYGLLVDEPNILEPDWYRRYLLPDSQTSRMRVICDYLAGMTDAYAIDQHKKLFP